MQSETVVQPNSITTVQETIVETTDKETKDIEGDTQMKDVDVTEEHHEEESTEYLQKGYESQEQPFDTDTFIQSPPNSPPRNPSPPKDSPPKDPSPPKDTPPHDTPPRITSPPHDTPPHVTSTHNSLQSDSQLSDQQKTPPVSPSQSKEKSISPKEKA